MINVNELQAEIGVRYYNVTKECIRVAEEYASEHHDDYTSSQTEAAKWLTSDAAEFAVQDMTQNMSQYDALAVIWCTGGLHKALYGCFDPYVDSPIAHFTDVIRHAVMPTCKSYYEPAQKDD